MQVQKKPQEILIVDDDPIIRDMMVDILSFEGYPIVIARNGREALEKMLQGHAYLVFLDMLMPIMDGREVCLELARKPDIRMRHAIVLMSALDNLLDTIPLQVDATMPKPFSVDDVLRIVEPFMRT
jgi:CheY-like chemotaxis protein